MITTAAITIKTPRWFAGVPVGAAALATAAGGEGGACTATGVEAICGGRVTGSAAFGVGLRSLAAAAALSDERGGVTDRIVIVPGESCFSVSTNASDADDTGTAFSAFANASADWKRCPGSFAIAVKIMSLRLEGRPGSKVIGGVGCVCSWANINE